MVIFARAIEGNEIFAAAPPNTVYEFVMHTEAMLVNPEERILTQGAEGKRLYFVADGDLEVGVLDHMNRMRFVRGIAVGQIFGEVALIFDVARTTTVVTTNYCTMASLTRDSLVPLFQSHPSVFSAMRK